MHAPVNIVSHRAILQGRIFFDQEGIRGGRRLFIYQMRDINGNDDTLLIVWANLKSLTMMRCVGYMNYVSMTVCTCHTV